MKTIEKLKDLIIWAKKNDIFLRDVGANPADNIKTFGLEDCSYLITNCLIKDYYFNECAGQYPNYAAASDILRIEILYHIGGIYLDVGDIFPGKQSIGTFSSEMGFLFSWDDGGIGNDVLASVAKGKVITEFRNYIYENYQLFYAPESVEHLPIPKHRELFFDIMGEYKTGENEHVYDYRNPLRTPESNFYRKGMCVFLAGPGAIRQFWMFKKYGDYPLFPDHYYARPLEHCSSWYTFEMNKRAFLSWVKNALIFLWSSTFADESLIKRHLIVFGYSEPAYSSASLLDILENLKKQVIPQQDQEKMDIIEEKIRKIEKFLSLLNQLWDKYVVEEDAYSKKETFLYNPYILFLNSMFLLSTKNFFTATVRHNAFLEKKENFFILDILFETPMEEIHSEDYLKKIMDKSHLNNRVAIFDQHIEALKLQIPSSSEEDKLPSFAVSLSSILFNRNKFNFSAYFFKDHNKYLGDIKKIKDWLESIEDRKEITPESVLAFIQEQGLLNDASNSISTPTYRM